MDETPQSWKIGLTDLELATDILKESQAHLAKAKSCGLTHILIDEVHQAEKCLANIKDITSFKTLQHKHTHIHIMFHWNPTKVQWNLGILCTPI